VIDLLPPSVAVVQVAQGLGHEPESLSGGQEARQPAQKAALCPCVPISKGYGDAVEGAGALKVVGAGFVEEEFAADAMGEVGPAVEVAGVAASADAVEFAIHFAVKVAKAGTGTLKVTLAAQKELVDRAAVAEVAGKPGEVVSQSQRLCPPGVSTSSHHPTPPPGANRSCPLNRSASNAFASRCPTPVSR